MNFSWNMLGMPLMTWAMAVRSSGVSPFILRAKRREAILRLRYTPQLRYAQ